MSYTRPDHEETQKQINACIARINAANTVQEQIEAIDQAQQFKNDYVTMTAICYVRFTMNTSDEFYAAENDYVDETAPLFEKTFQELSDAMYDSKFRKELEKHYGTLVFKNIEISRRSFKPELMELMKEENKLQSEYQKLYAGLTVEFDGQTMPLPLLEKYKQSTDRAVRRAAFEAEGIAFDAHREELDTLFDKLVKNRNAQGRMLGHENYIPLGYDRLGRNCYTQKEVAAFREQIARDLVPVIEQVKANQRKRIGVDQIYIYDNEYRFRDGNAAPEGTAEEILATGKKMYQNLSPETKEFIEFMFDRDLFDVLSREGKAPRRILHILPEL